MSLKIESSYLTKSILDELTDDWADCLMAEPVSSYSSVKNNTDGNVVLLMEALCMRLQHNLCRALEKVEMDSGSDAVFQVDKWMKDGDKLSFPEGGGITCVIDGGAAMDKGGINVSSIGGKLNPAASAQMKSRGIEISNDARFNAVGISSVLHPVNPFAPTTHFNFRFFELSNNIINGEDKKVWWFGGGSDLTPYYLFEEDALHFHSQFKEACDRHNPDYYSRFKKWCDEYFLIKHRNECRGVGGIFFDDLNDDTVDKIIEFVRSCMSKIIPAYVPILSRRKDMHYSQKNIDWQQIRRGRYVEFNLIYDRGTKFGLNVPGSRIESILMSLPNTAAWKYCHEPEPSTEEYKLLQVLKNPIEWL